MQKKSEKTLEVVVVLTPAQIESIFTGHPREMSFTRKLITWDLQGRRRRMSRAKKIIADRDKIVVIPDYRLVPAFELKAK